MKEASLLLEEQKAQKMIEETKRKAKSLLYLKLQNQHHLILKEGGYFVHITLSHL